VELKRRSAMSKTVAFLVGKSKGELHVVVAEGKLSGPASPAAHFALDKTGRLHLAIARDIWDIIHRAIESGEGFARYEEFVHVDLSSLKQYDVTDAPGIDQYPCRKAP
jgi:hypothetical protein